MYYRYRDPAKEAERYEALLSIGESVIFEREGRPFEDFRRIYEIEPMLLDVALPLRFVPSESHDATVYTLRTYVNLGSASP